MTCARTRAGVPALRRDAGARARPAVPDVLVADDAVAGAAATLALHAADLAKQRVGEHAVLAQRGEAVTPAVTAHLLDHAVADAREPGPLPAPEAGPPFVALFRPPGHRAGVFPDGARHGSPPSRARERGNVLPEAVVWHGVLLDRKTPREAGPPPRTASLVPIPEPHLPSRGIHRALSVAGWQARRPLWMSRPCYRRARHVSSNKYHYIHMYDIYCLPSACVVQRPAWRTPSVTPDPELEQDRFAGRDRTPCLKGRTS